MSDPTTGCCDLHGRHCEPPGDLCCTDCTEAAHDTFPVRHADGTRCVLGEPEQLRDMATMLHDSFADGQQLLDAIASTPGEAAS